jgi:predicted MFS family arabinose efflux permease
MCALLVVFAALMALVPHAEMVEAAVKPSAGTPRLGRRAFWRIGAIAASTFAVGLCSGIIWVYYSVIGDRAGLPAGAVEAAIGLSIFAAGVGAGLATVVEGRFGRTLPLTVMLVAIAVSVLVLSRQPSALAFRVASCTQMASIYFLFPYFLGAGAAEDSSGAGSAYVGSAFFLSGALSPFIGGVLSESVGIAAVGTGVTVVSAVVAVAFIVLGRTAAARHPVPAATRLERRQA